MMKTRFAEIDIARAVAVLMMITFHILFDVNSFEIYSINVDTGFLWWFARVTAGTFIFIALRRLIIFFKHDIEIYVPFQVQWLEQIMTGVMLLLIIIFRPQGLLPEKPTKMRGLDYGRFHDELGKKGVKVPERRAEKANILQRLLSVRKKATSQ